MLNNTKIETAKANGGGYNVHVYVFGRLVHTLWTAGSAKDGKQEAKRLSSSVTTSLEPFTFRDGSVKDAYVTWFNDYGNRRCIAVTQIGTVR